MRQDAGHQGRCSLFNTSPADDLRLLQLHVGKRKMVNSTRRGLPEPEKYVFQLLHMVLVSRH